MAKNKQQQEFVNGVDAATILGVSRRTIGNMIRDGRLRAHRMPGGRDLFIKRADIEAALQPVEVEVA
jgi:excisionase family DNA binding protein